MFQKIVISFIVFFSAIVQVSVFPPLFPERAVPEAMLVLVIFWTIREGFEKSLLRTILTGLTMDVIGSGVVGVHIISMVIISFFISFLAKRYLVLDRFWRVLVAIIIVAVSLIMYIAVEMFLSKLIGYLNGLENSPGFYFVLDYFFIWKLIFTVVLFTVLYGPLKRIELIISAYNQRILNQNRVFSRR